MHSNCTQLIERSAQKHEELWGQPPPPLPFSQPLLACFYCLLLCLFSLQQPSLTNTRRVATLHESLYNFSDQIDGIILVVTGVVAYAGTASLVAVLNTSETSLAVADSSLINVGLPDVTPIMVQRHLIAAAGGSVHVYLPVEDALKVSLCTV